MVCEHKDKWKPCIIEMHEAWKVIFEHVEPHLSLSQWLEVFWFPFKQILNSILRAELANEFQSGGRLKSKGCPL